MGALIETRLGLEPNLALRTGCNPSETLPRFSSLAPITRSVTASYSNNTHTKQGASNALYGLVQVPSACRLACPCLDSARSAPCTARPGLTSLAIRPRSTASLPKSAARNLWPCSKTLERKVVRGLASSSIGKAACIELTPSSLSHSIKVCSRAARVSSRARKSARSFRTACSIARMLSELLTPRIWTCFVRL